MDAGQSGATSSFRRRPSRSPCTRRSSPRRPDTRRGVSAAARIVADASALFARDGYHGTSLKEIADAVGIPKATLMHHFPTQGGPPDRGAAAPGRHAGARRTGRPSRPREELTGIGDGAARSAPRRAGTDRGLRRALVRGGERRPSGARVLRAALRPDARLLHQPARAPGRRGTARRRRGPRRGTAPGSSPSGTGCSTSGSTSPTRSTSPACSASTRGACSRGSERSGGGDHREHGLAVRLALLRPDAA